MLTKNEQILQAAEIELARRELFYYAKIRAPDFYKEDRDYLVELCEEIQAFVETDKEEVLIINAPPRYGSAAQRTRCGMGPRKG